MLRSAQARKKLIAADPSTRIWELQWRTAAPSYVRPFVLALTVNDASQAYLEGRRRPCPIYAHR